MYKKSYWLKKGLSEYEATKRESGLVRCSWCRRFFHISTSKSSGKHICSNGCVYKDKHQQYLRMVLTKRLKGRVRCEVCNSSMKKANSLLTYKNICSENCLCKYKITIDKTSIWKSEYWCNKGFSVIESNAIVSNIQRRNSKASLDYYLTRGYTKAEAIIERQRYQSNTSSQHTNRKLTNKFCFEYYLQHGYDLEEAKVMAKQAANTTSLDSYIKRHGEVEGSMLYNQMIETVKYKKSLEYLIDCHGETEGKRIYDSRKTSFRGRASKISNALFTELDKHINEFTFHDTRNSEYLVRSGNRIYFYDYTIPNRKICIELNGSVWHGDPLFYSAEEMFYERPYSEIWEYDYTKHRAIAERGYTVIYIWYQKNKQFRLYGNTYSTLTEVVNAILQEIDNENN